jgi:hypothetical protein
MPTLKIAKWPLSHPVYATCNFGWSYGGKGVHKLSQDVTIIRHKLWLSTETWFIVALYGAQITQIVTKFPSFYGTQRSVPCSQKLVPLSCPQPYKYSTFTVTLSFRLNIILTSIPRSSKGYLSFRITDQNILYFRSLPCVLHSKPFFI